MRLRRLRLAGYPLAVNDLSMEEWLDLGRAEEFMQRQKQAQGQAELIGLLCMAR